MTRLSGEFGLLAERLARGNALDVGTAGHPLRSTTRRNHRAPRGRLVGGCTKSSPAVGQRGPNPRSGTRPRASALPRALLRRGCGGTGSRPNRPGMPSSRESRLSGARSGRNCDLEARYRFAAHAEGIARAQIGAASQPETMFGGPVALVNAAVPSAFGLAPGRLKGGCPSRPAESGSDREFAGLAHRPKRGGAGRQRPGSRRPLRLLALRGSNRRAGRLATSCPPARSRFPSISGMMTDMHRPSMVKVEDVLSSVSAAESG